METPQPGEKYRHYKTGNEYEIIGIGHHSETLEQLVLYRGLYISPEFGANPLWARPLAMFLDMVLWEGSTVRRFTKLG